MGAKLDGAPDVEEGEIIQGGDIHKGAGESSQTKSVHEDEQNVRSDEAEVQPRVYASARARKVIARQQKLNLLKSQKLKSKVSSPSGSRRDREEDWPRSSFREPRGNNNSRHRRWQQEPRMADERNEPFRSRSRPYHQPENNPRTPSREVGDYQASSLPYGDQEVPPEQRVNQEPYDPIYPENQTFERPPQASFQAPLMPPQFSTEHPSSFQAPPPLPHEYPYPQSNQYPPHFSRPPEAPQYLSAPPVSQPFSPEQNPSAPCNPNVLQPNVPFPQPMHQPASPPPTAPFYELHSEQGSHQTYYQIAPGNHYERYQNLQPQQGILPNNFQQPNHHQSQIIIEPVPPSFAAPNTDPRINPQANSESANAAGPSEGYGFQPFPIEPFHDPLAESIPNPCPSSNYAPMAHPPTFGDRNQMGAVSGPGQSHFRSEFQSQLPHQSFSTPQPGFGMFIDKKTGSVDGYPVNPQWDVSVNPNYTNEEDLSNFDEEGAKKEARKILIRLATWGVTAEYLIGRGVSKDLVVMMFGERGFKLPESLAPKPSLNKRKKEKIKEKLARKQKVGSSSLSKSVEGRGRTYLTEEEGDFKLRRISKSDPRSKAELTKFDENPIVRDPRRTSRVEDFVEPHREKKSAAKSNRESFLERRAPETLSPTPKAGSFGKPENSHRRDKNQTGIIESRYHDGLSRSRRRGERSDEEIEDEDSFYIERDKNMNSEKKLSKNTTTNDRRVKVECFIKEQEGERENIRRTKRHERNHDRKIEDEDYDHAYFEGRRYSFNEEEEQSIRRSNRHEKDRHRQADEDEYRKATSRDGFEQCGYISDKKESEDTIRRQSRYEKSWGSKIEHGENDFRFEKRNYTVKENENKEEMMIKAQEIHGKDRDQKPRRNENDYAACFEKLSSQLEKEKEIGEEKVKRIAGYKGNFYHKKVEVDTNDSKRDFSRSEKGKYLVKENEKDEQNMEREI